MTSVEFDESCVRQINADVRASYDKDYGAPTTHHLDPRNEADERPWTDLAYHEQRERLAGMPQNELITECIQANADSVIGWAKARRLAFLVLGGADPELIRKVAGGV